MPESNPDITSLLALGMSLVAILFTIFSFWWMNARQGELVAAGPQYAFGRFESGKLAFRWLSGGPREAPSTFEFTVAGAVLKEEVYELTADEGSDRYRLRYRALEPALGVLEYDAVLDVEPIGEGATFLRAERAVRLAPGSPPDMLAGMVEGEMQALKEHFAAEAVATRGS